MRTVPKPGSLKVTYFFQNRTSNCSHNIHCYDPSHHIMHTSWSHSFVKYRTICPSLRHVKQWIVDCLGELSRLPCSSWVTVLTFEMAAIIASWSWSWPKDSFSIMDSKPAILYCWYCSCCCCCTIGCWCYCTKSLVPDSEGVNIPHAALWDLAMHCPKTLCER